MTDLIDKANADYETWLNSKVKQTQAPPNNITDCVDCGEPIGVEHKKAVPYALRCVICQSQFECTNKGSRR